MAGEQAAAEVLVVDDAPTYRERLASLLRDGGHAVCTAATAAQALELVRAAAKARATRPKPDLIIAAMVMPALDGYEFVRELRAEPATAAIPVVFSSASRPGPEAWAFATACGVTRILTSPYDGPEVLAVVGRALENPAPPPAPLPDDEFHRRHLRMLNARLLAKIDELEEIAQLAGALHREVAAALQAGSDAQLATLSPRQKEVLIMLGDGASNRDIAGRLGIAPSTVQSHVKSILHKLGAKNRTEAAVRYMRG